MREGNLLNCLVLICMRKYLLSECLTYIGKILELLGNWLIYMRKDDQIWRTGWNVRGKNLVSLDDWLLAQEKVVHPAWLIRLCMNTFFECEWAICVQKMLTDWFIVYEKCLLTDWLICMWKMHCSKTEWFIKLIQKRFIIPYKVWLTINRLLNLQVNEWLVWENVSKFD